MTNWLKRIMGDNGSSKNTEPSQKNTEPKPLDYTRKISMSDWLKTVSNCSYSYAYDETGIAVDTANQSVILIQHIDRLPITKTYPFNQIREWSYEIPSPKVVTPNGRESGSTLISMAMINRRYKNEAKDNTGFKVRVKDIDYPEWFIKFESTKTVSTDLTRWTEIFNQYVNEGA